MGAETKDFQMQWMLFQEKFQSIDKEFGGVKVSIQQVIDSLKDVLDVLESLEDVHVTGDKLSSEVRSRIFKEIDRWNDDRHLLDSILEEIRTQIAEVGENLNTNVTDHTCAYEKLQEDLSALNEKIKTLSRSVEKSSTETVHLKSAIETFTTSNTFQEILKIVRTMACLDETTGQPLKIASGDWFRWHTKKGFSGVITTIIVAVVCSILIPLFYLFAPHVNLLHSGR